MQRLLQSVAILLMLAGQLPAADPAPKVAVVSTIGSERASSGAGVKIVTFDGKTHIVWQDATEQGYFNRIRTWDAKTGAFSEPFTLNRGKDNHARPVIAMDEQGYLHVILSGHGSPVTYRRSLKPNDASAFTKAEPAGSGTYPMITCGPPGVLFLTMRTSKAWNGVDLYVKEKNQPWRKQCKLVYRDPELPGYAGFQTGLAWDARKQILHAVIDFYESKETYRLRGIHQAVCYLQSADAGRTWRKANGEAIQLPARPESLDILAQSRKERHEKLPPPSILAQGSIVVDPQGAPHVMYISHLEEPGRILHCTPNEKGVWKQSPVTAAQETFPTHRPVGCRGSLSIDDSGALHVLLKLSPLGSGWKQGKPLRGGNFSTKGKRLIWLHSSDNGQSFTATAALPSDQIFNEPNVERPAGFNQIPGGNAPPFVYFDGTNRYPKKGEVLQNTVYLVQP